MTDRGGAMAPDKTVRWSVLVAAAAGAILVGIVIAALLGGEAGMATQSPASPTVRSTPSASPSATTRSEPSLAASPSATPSAATAELLWDRTGSFPSAEGHSMVHNVAQLGSGYVAVGVEYLAPLPLLGPTPPHVARVWTSSDGRSWQSVEPNADFDNVTIGSFIERGDGLLLALGGRGLETEFGIADFELAAWTTSDGLTWTEIDPPVENMSSAVQGATGALGVVRPSEAGNTHELWHSTDGITWQVVHSVEAAYVNVDAGDEGFTVVGRTPGEPGVAFAVASSDGQEWFEASSSPFGQFLDVAALSGNWIVVDDIGARAPTWFSANGLDWAPHGEVPLQTLEVDGAECREFVTHVSSADPWLVIPTQLAYPCSEGEFVVHGTQFISIDGATWHPLPLAEGTPGETRSGSAVNDAIATAGGLVLVGEENGGAAFWFGEAP